MEHEKKLNIIGIVIRVLIIAPALIAGLVVMSSGVNADSDQVLQEAFKESVAFNAVMNISYITIISAATLVVLFFLILLVKRPATAIKSVLGIIIAAIFFFILYAVGTTDTSESLNLSGGLTADQGVVNFTHAGIITALTAIVICAILALGLGFVLKIVRKN